MMILKNRVLTTLVVIGLSACTSSGSRIKASNPSRAALVNAQLGSGYLAQGKLEASKNKFEKALQQDSGLPEAHAGYGLLLSRLGETDQAEKHFKKALRADPYSSETLNNYGTFLCSQNRIDEAEKQFLAALRDPLYKTPEYAYSNAGSCSMKNNDPERAEAYFGKALQSNPRFPAALFQMASLKNKSGDLRLAYSYMQRFNEYGTHTPDSLWLGIKLAKVEGDKNAQASYELLLKNKFPKSEQASLLRSVMKLQNNR